MIAMNSRLCLRVAYAAAALAVAATNALPLVADEAVPAAVALAVRHNANALNPLTVSWEQKSTSPLALDDLLALIRRPNQRELLLPEYVTMTYQGGVMCYNRRKTQWVGKGYSKWNSDITFDGKLLYSSDTTQIIRSVAIRDLEHLRAYCPKCYVLYAEYFEAAGFQVHNRNVTIHQPPESLLLYLIGHGAGVTALGMSQ